MCSKSAFGSSCNSTSTHTCRWRQQLHQCSRQRRWRWRERWGCPCRQRWQTRRSQSPATHRQVCNGQSGQSRQEKAGSQQRRWWCRPCWSSAACTWGSRGWRWQWQEESGCSGPRAGHQQCRQHRQRQWDHRWSWCLLRLGTAEAAAAAAAVLVVSTQRMRLQQEHKQQQIKV
jgi:hypothetical protein